MKVLFDLFPVIFFFVAYTGAKQAPDSAASIVSSLLSGLGMSAAVGPEQAPLLLATAVTIVATAAQVGWLLVRRRKVDNMLWVSLAIIVVLGGATLALRDPTFIKWKPTALYWTFAAVLLGASLFLKKNLIRTMMQAQLSLPDVIWTRLNLSWVAFFVLMGVVNLYVAYNYSESTWVSFKLFGGIGLMVAFVVLQGLMLSRFLESEQRK